MRVELKKAQRRAVVSSVVSQRDSRPRFEVYVDESLSCSGSFPSLAKALRDASAHIGCDKQVVADVNLVGALRRAGVDVRWDE